MSIFHFFFKKIIILFAENQSSSSHTLDKPSEANYLHLTNEENGDLRDPMKTNILLVLELTLPTFYLAFFSLKYEGGFLF